MRSVEMSTSPVQWRVGSFSTDPAILACWSMSAPPRKWTCDQVKTTELVCHASQPAREHATGS